MFDFTNLFIIMPKLILAAILGGLIGLDREYSRRPAGLRTHALVAIGAAVLMHLNQELFLVYPNIDPGRFGAQVISGIGFLGAGTIIKEGPTIHGLTTAAGLWAVSSVGLSVGSGNFDLAISTTLVILIVLRIFDYFERKMKIRRKITSIYLETTDVQNIINTVTKMFEKFGFEIKELSTDYVSNRGHSLSLKVDFKQSECTQLLDDLTNHPDITKIKLR